MFFMNINLLSITKRRARGKIQPREKEGTFLYLINISFLERFKQVFASNKSFSK